MLFATGHDIPIDVANLMGYATAMVLYGITAILFTSTIPPLWKRRNYSPIVFWTTLMLVTTSTVVIGLYTALIYNAFIVYRESPGTSEYLETSWTPIWPLINFFLGYSGIIADFLLSWRLYIIWGKTKKVLIVPAVCIIIDIVCALGLLATTMLAQEQFFIKYRVLYLIFIMVWVGATLIMNISSTLMIVGKVWWVSRTVHAPHVQSLYKAVIVTLIESGALYTVTLLTWVLCALIPHGNGSGKGIFMEYVLVMVTGISPMLIIRHLQKTEHSRSGTTTPIAHDKGAGHNGSTAIRYPRTKFFSGFSPDDRSKTLYEATFSSSANTHYIPQSSSSQQQQESPHEVQNRLSTVPTLPEQRWSKYGHDLEKGMGMGENEHEGDVVDAFDEHDEDEDEEVTSLPPLSRPAAAGWAEPGAPRRIAPFSRVARAAEEAYGPQLSLLPRL